MRDTLPRLTRADNLKLNAVLFAPQLIQGPVVYRRGTLPVAERLGVARRAVRLLDGFRQRYGEGPIWASALGEPVLLVLAPRHIKQVLEGSPEPFASDTRAKKAVFGTFAPETVIISRGEEWHRKHQFVAGLLDAERPYHRLAERFLRVCDEEVGSLVAWSDRHGGMVRYNDLANMQQRLVRRIIFGDAAADDREVTQWLFALAADANTTIMGRPAKHAQLRPKLLARIDGYLARAEPGSLVSVVKQMQVDRAVHPPHQIPHALFNLAGTAVMGIMRTLLLIASHPKVTEVVERELAEGDLTDPAQLTAMSYLEGCVMETFRLYPIPTIARVTTEATTFDGHEVPAGTEVLVSNWFHHRDGRRHWFADSFEPTIWETDVADDWTLNPLSRGPEFCTGAGLLLLVVKAVVGGIVKAREVAAVRPVLSPQRPMPHALDPFRIELRLSQRR